MPPNEIYVRVVVHGDIPAESEREALNRLCAMIRDGIGDEPRKWGVSIAAGRSGMTVLLNENYAARNAGSNVQDEADFALGDRERR